MSFPGLLRCVTPSLVRTSKTDYPEVWVVPYLVLSVITVYPYGPVDSSYRQVLLFTKERGTRICPPAIIFPPRIFLSLRYEEIGRTGTISVRRDHSDTNPDIRRTPRREYLLHLPEPQVVIYPCVSPYPRQSQRFLDHPTGPTVRRLRS